MGLLYYMNEMINNDNDTNQNNVDILGTSEGKNENYRTFNGVDSTQEDFMCLDSPWFLSNDYS